MAIQAQFYSDNFGLCLGASSQDSFMENGCGFDNLCLTPQQQQQFMQFDHHQFHNFPNHKNLNFFAVDNNNNNNNHQFHHPQTAPFSAHIDKQRHEFEQFLNLQNERLRLALQEQRKQQEAILLKKYESKTRFLLTQKDEEIAKASNRNKELQNLLRKMEMERHVWQRAANENESTIASLNGLIQRLRESVCLSENAAEDAESCCPNTAQEEGENGKLMMCKCCNSRNCCVIMLPCRHLSCCKDCEVFLDSCPVCRMAKKASIEALI